MFIPIFTLNTDKRAWGKDAQEFRYVTFDLTSSSSRRHGSELMFICLYGVYHSGRNAGKTFRLAPRPYQEYGETS